PTCKLIERSLGPPEAFPILFARGAFMALVHQQGVCGPTTVVLRSSDDLRRCSEDLGFPMVLKADGTSGGNGVRIVRNLDEALGVLHDLSSPPMLARALKRTLVDHD